MKYQNLLMLVLVIMLGFASSAQGMDCPACHAANIPGLAMTCPECNVNLHDPVLKLKNQERSELCVRVLYTGDNLDRLPAYGKLFINGNYQGNIDLIEKEQRNPDFAPTWNNGLGSEYTAMYEKVFDKVAPGVLKIEVEMKFDRLYGLGRSFKRVVFPYVGFKVGEKTTVVHYFNSASTFHLYKPGKRQSLPIVADTKIQGASGTVAINIGLFK